MHQQLKTFLRPIRAAFVVFGCFVFALQPGTALADTFNDNVILFYDPNSAVSTCGGLPTTEGAGGDASSATSTGFTLGPIGNAAVRQKALVAALMKDFALSAPQAAGIVGNFMHESGGKNLPPNINEILKGVGGAGPPRFNGGYGWAQWTGPRQRTFINYAVTHKFMASSTVDANDAANYAYLKHELSTGYTNTISELRSIRKLLDETDGSVAARSAVSFEDTFERARVPALEPRKANAIEALAAYNGAPGPIPGAPGGGATAGCPDESAAGGGVGISGNYAFPLSGPKSVVKNPGMFKNNTADRGGHPYTAYDILANPGVRVVAFLSGRVEHIGKDRCPGKLVSIYNKEANLTISYLHLSFSGPTVKEGQTVTVGQQVGVVGAAANGCGTPHLHIDAAQGNDRPGCSRLNCPSSNASKFVNIGPQLYTTFQKLP